MQKDLVINEENVNEEVAAPVEDEAVTILSEQHFENGVTVQEHSDGRIAFLFHPDTDLGPVAMRNGTGTRVAQVFLNGFTANQETLAISANLLPPQQTFQRARR